MCGEERRRGGRGEEGGGLTELLSGDWLRCLLSVDTACVASRVRAPLRSLRRAPVSSRFVFIPGSSDHFIHISCPLRRVW